MSVCLSVSILHKTRKTEHGTTEHGTLAEQRNAPEQWRNNRKPFGTPAEHPRTTKPYKTKNNCSVFQRKFTLHFNTFETLFIADMNYLFISLYLRLFSTKLKIF